MTFSASCKLKAWPSDSRRTDVVAYGIGYLTESTSGTVARRSHIDAVEQVEDFHPELCADAFGNFRVFINGEVQRTVCWLNLPAYLMDTNLGTRYPSSTNAVTGISKVREY
jgi:hypothetical protein